MKNLRGIIGYSVAGIMAVLTLAWNAMAFQTAKILGRTNSVSIYDVYSEAASGDVQTAKIMSIIALVLACILTVTCVLGLLNELGVVKIKFMNYVNYAVAGLFVLFALLAIIFCAVNCGDYNDLAGTNVLSVGAGLIMVLISAVASLAGILTATIRGKKNA